LPAALEATKLEPEAEPIVDVRALWSALIAAELEKRPRLRASSSPVYDESYGGNIVEYNADDFTLEFSPEEIVRVFQGELQIGVLDVRGPRSPGKLVFRELTRPGAIRPGVELRLDSLQATSSMERRSAAVARLLGNEAVIDDLITFFDPASDAQPNQVDEWLPRSEDLDRYELNESQREAFTHLWSHRPLGLLQGPPGTGKSTFIAAFVHYALTRGRIRSVLVLSQAHAAANAVGEKIRAVAEAVAEPVTMLRFGTPNNVSAELLPIHAGAIQNAYREVFLSNLEERLIAAGEQLALSKRYLHAAYRLESRLRGLLRPTAIGRNPEAGASSLESTPLNELLEEYGIDPMTSVAGLRDLLHEALSEQLAVRSPKAARQYRRLLDLSWSWPEALRYGERTLEELLVRTRQVVVGTCNGSGRRKLGIDKKTFDLVIIDEAARCDPGDLAIAMQSGAWIVLVGDHKQLPPYVDDDIATVVLEKLGLANKKSLLQSDFERVFRSSYGRVVGRTLVEQYRMAPPIRALVSSLYYESAGLRDAQAREHSPAAYELLGEPFGSPLTWWDTSNMGDEAHEARSRDGSFTNAVEARMIVHLLRRLENADSFWQIAPANTNIGVICMYAAQKRHVTELIDAAGFDGQFRKRVKIDTVDGYQGQENDIVMLSLVRNNQQGNIGFVSDAQRANVALSRAKERLIIVGSAMMFEGARRQNDFGHVARYIRNVPDIGNRNLPASFGR
jgi:hypothetical protein